jgi:rfaE bifunctional protein kinase chain/domain
MPIYRNVDDLIRDISLNGPGKRVVFVSGKFNVVHPGHLRLFQFARECGDLLVVGVIESGLGGITVPMDMRCESVQAISIVDYTCHLQLPLDDFIVKLKPDIIVKGKEYQQQFNPEQKLAESYGGKLLFSSGELRFSSMDLLEQEYLGSSTSTIVKPEDFPQRHAFTLDTLKGGIKRFKDLRVGVIGDLIVDEYITCEALGMSQEDPTIVVTPIERKRFVGGAGIVAAHARGMGATVDYISVCGWDEPFDFARKIFDDLGITCAIIKDESRPTTLKKRYRASGKTLLRISELRQHSIAPNVAAKLIKAVLDVLPKLDLLIFSDFNYGCLPQHLVDALAQAAQQHKVPMVADSQSSSQMSDISRFRGMLLLTPTEREARLAVRDYESGLPILADLLRQRADAQNVMITLGTEGTILWGHENGEHMMDRLPAFNTAPKDPAGAGDSLLACASMALVTGSDIWQAGYIGALAAACQVSRVGNTPLMAEDLLQEINGS